MAANGRRQEASARSRDGAVRPRRPSLNRGQAEAVAYLLQWRTASAVIVRVVPVRPVSQGTGERDERTLGAQGRRGGGGGAPRGGWPDEVKRVRTRANGALGAEARGSERALAR
ncbi:hypothetical protein GCM10010187_63950 [Actinomadura coerulea]|nr:hypothetical protein GCM10010187_63950 [Actinomadura coerulea]